MRVMLHDVRYAVRMMLKNPPFAAVAIIVIALGVGSNSALFSVVNAVLLEPLPYPESDRLVQIGRQLPMGRSDAVSITQFMFWRDNSESFESMATHDGRGGGINLVEGDRPERIASIRVSFEFFSTLGATPQLGRDFEAEDCVEGAAPVAVISDDLWRRRFSGDPSIVGRVLRLSGNSYTVVGVMERGFDFKTHADIWTPLTLISDPQNGSAVYYVIARMKPDATVVSAQAEMDTVGEQLYATFPAIVNPEERPFVRTHLDQVVGNVRPVLYILLGAVGLVLLIACANVANLLLARATGRQREMALRATLGAGRLRLVRQLLTESMLLALIGGVLGLLVARWSMGLLVALRPSSLPRLDVIELDGKVLAFTFAATVLTGILFGLVPALQACKIDLQRALKEGTAGAGVGTRRGRARGMLVISEIALALVLLIGAALLIDSFVRVIRLDPGFDYEHALTAKMSLAGMQELTTERFVSLTTQMAERLAASPGVEAAATISTLPLEHGLMSFFDVEGKVDPSAARPAGASQWRMISPDYFKAMGIPLLKGRAFTAHDTLESPAVVIINNALARRYFPDEDPVGKRLVTGDPSSEDSMNLIVGVVGDVKEITLDRPAVPTLYSPAAQSPDGATAFVANVMPTCWVLRTAGDPLSYGGLLQDEILAVDGELPVSSIRPMKELMGASIAARQFNTLLLAVFAGLALLLALVGIYGVMSYSVAQRTGEIGIRMALGATRRRTLWLVLAQGMKLAIIGVIIGAAGALGLTRFMSSMLYEISATDPAVFIIVAITLLLVACVACLVPALRATRVDPMVALRTE